MADTVLDGALIPIDPDDERVLSFDYDTESLVAGVTIASQSMQIIPLRPSGVTVSSITLVSTTATVTTAAAHGFATNDWVTIAGAVQTGYNISAQITVTSTTVFTMTTASGLTTPATTTGTIVASKGLRYDNDSILTDAPYSSRYTQLRLISGGDTYRGYLFEVASRITTDESPSQTKNKSVRVLIENQKT